MFELHHHKSILTLFVLLNLVLVIWNYAESMSTARFLTASTVVLYDVRPVERMHVSIDTLERGYFEPWSSTVSKTGLTDLQLAKFHLGCYAAASPVVFENGTTVPLPWRSSKDMTTFNNYDPSTRSALLSSMQVLAGGTKSRSACNCIDQMLSSKLKNDETLAVVQQNFGNALLNWQQNNDEMAAIERYVYTSGLTLEQQKVAAVNARDPFSALEGVSGYTADSVSINKATFEAFRTKVGFTETGKDKYIFDDNIAANSGGVKLMDKAAFIAWRDSLAGGDLDGNLEINEEEFNKWQETHWRPTGLAADKSYITYKFSEENGGSTTLDSGMWTTFTGKPHQAEALMFIYNVDPVTTQMVGQSLLTADLSNMRYSGMLAANFPLEDDDTLALQDWKDKHTNSDKHFTRYNDKAKAYKRDIVNFCMRHGMPQLETTFEGTVEVNTMIAAGLVLILAAARRDFQRHVWLPSEASHSYLRRLWNFVTVSIIVGGSIFYLVQQMRLTVETNAKSVAYRTTAYSSVAVTPLNVGLYIVLLLLIVVEFVYVVADVKIIRDMHLEQYFIYDEAHTFLVFTVGWLLLGVGLLLQANVKHVNSVYVFVIIITGACTVQYLSNYFAKIYQKLFRFLDVAQGVAIQTEKTLHNTCLAKFRSFMQFIGWGRLLISVTVILHAIFIITVAHESAAMTPLQSLADGRLLYYAIAFLLANCGFDLVYEVLPFVFDDKQARLVRLYFIMIFVLYINVMVRLYLHTNINEKWQKQFPAVE